MELRPGLKILSDTSTAQLIVIKGSGDRQVNLAGGPARADGPAGTDAVAGDVLQVGKRYVDSDGSCELLCAHAGAGPIEVDGQTLTIQAAAALPSSD